MSRRRMLSTLAVASAMVAAGALPMTPAAVAQSSQVYELGKDVTPPQVVHEVKPKYTAKAMQQKIQGSVWLDVVVGDTGDVTSVTVTRSLDAEYGLDEEAVKAARQWKFKPGTRNGKPVAVRVTLELTFTLKK